VTSSQIEQRLFADGRVRPVHSHFANDEVTHVTHSNSKQRDATDGNGATELQVLKELIEAGKVTPVIDRTHSLSEVPETIRYLEEGHARGKVVITV